jgi:hypothetical protein
MTPGFDSWESYFYPPPDDGTLRNLPTACGRTLSARTGRSWTASWSTAAVVFAFLNQASQLSRPDMFAYNPEPASLVPVFRAIAQPRANGPTGP